MKLLKCSATNFGSYAALEFDFSAPGLSLIHGPTGSGKSTIPDIACWALFGQTAKDGAVDDIKSWKCPNAPTSVTLQIEVNNIPTTIVRTRGKGANDLYVIIEDSTIRGKDLLDTQKIIDKLLGIDVDTYISQAYYHEFNSTGSFFTAKAKDRKALLERIANLELPVSISDKASAKKKDINASSSLVSKAIAKQSGKVEQLEIRLAADNKNAANWDKSRLSLVLSLMTSDESYEADKHKKISQLKLQSDNFLREKASKILTLKQNIEELNEKVKPLKFYDTKIKDLNSLTSEPCDTCGQPKDCQDILTKLNKLQELKNINNQLHQDRAFKSDRLSRTEAEQNPFLTQIELLKEQTNPFKAQIERETTKINPFHSSLKRVEQELLKEKEAMNTSAAKLEEYVTELHYIKLLQELTDNLRIELLRQAINHIENSTNKYLEDYFDSELRVSFEVEADDIDIKILKSQYICNFKQLSKGQRRLLALCFSISVMDLASSKLEQLFLDEPTDGLDTELKIKSFKLFEYLATKYTSVFVIEHSPELKVMFDNSIEIAMENEESYVKL